MVGLGSVSYLVSFSYFFWFFGVFWIVCLWFGIFFFLRFVFICVFSGGVYLLVVFDWFGVFVGSLLWVFESISLC